MTQDFLSHMQRRKLIEYSRGNITILDDRGLEAACCSCYQIVKDINHAAPRARPTRSRRVPEGNKLRTKARLRTLSLLGDTYVRERTAPVRASRYAFSKMGALLIG